MITANTFTKINHQGLFPLCCGGPDGKIPPAPGTNLIAGFVEFRLLTSWEKNKNKLWPIYYFATQICYVDTLVNYIP